MKRNIIHTLWAVALPLLLVSCQQEELPGMNGASDTTPLSITVTDGGYVSTDKAATRATENGYRTEFTDDDACGLYLVRNGAIVYDNVKLTATAGTNGSLTWQPEAGVTLAGGMAGEKYFLLVMASGAALSAPGRGSSSCVQPVSSSAAAQRVCRIFRFIVTLFILTLRYLFLSSLRGKDCKRPLPQFRL